MASDGLSANCPNTISGRQFTSWAPRCNEVSTTQPRNSFDYRMFMTHNAEQIMQQQRKEAKLRTACPCFGDDEDGTMLPEQQYQVCDTQTCTQQPGPHGGLGTGRDYSAAPTTRDSEFPAGGRQTDVYSQFSMPS